MIVKRKEGLWKGKKDCEKERRERKEGYRKMKIDID